MKNANQRFFVQQKYHTERWLFKKENLCEAFPKSCVAFGNRADAKQGGRGKIQ